MKNFLNLKKTEIVALLSNGFVKLPSIKTKLNTEEFINKIVEEMGSSTFLTSTNSHKAILKKLGVDEYLAPTLFKIAKETFNYKGSINNQYHVVRMVRPGDIKEQYRAHFDSHIFTLVIPINIPFSKDMERGELIFYPNARRYPRTEIENFIGKVYFKKYANKTSMKELIKNKKAIMESFDDLRPILFNGMTTLHTNRFVHPTINQNRLTILAHFFDPSPAYGIGSILRKVRKR